MSTPTDIPDFVSKQVLKSRYIFLNLAQDPEEGLVTTCAGREACESSFDLSRNGFRYYAVEMILSGHWELECNGRITTLTPGSIFSYEPNTSFSLRAHSGATHIKYFVDFTGNDAADLLAQAGLEPGVPIALVPVHWLRELYDHILDCQRYPKPVAQEMCTYLTRSLLLRIGQDARPHTRPARDSFETYQRCRNYIRENFLSVNSIDEVSRACHLDRAYLSRLFKKHLGESPHQLLIRMKMEYAAELLRNQHLSVKAVALEVGYPDPFHFSRVFKKNFGLSPRMFREQ